MNWSRQPRWVTNMDTKWADIWAAMEATEAMVVIYMAAMVVDYTLKRNTVEALEVCFGRFEASAILFGYGSTHAHVKQYKQKCINETIYC